MDNIKRLETELINHKWSSSSELISYLLQTSDEEIPLSEVKELKRLAEIQIKNNISLEYFI